MPVFLNKDPFGDYSLSGSIFLDSRNNADFSDHYNLVYGHHMEHGFMFGALDSYLTNGYMLSHNKGVLSVDDIYYTIEIYAVLETDASDDIIFEMVGSDSELYQYIKTHSLFYDDSLCVTESDKIIALSTCKYPDTSERTVVIGRLLDNESK